MTTSPEYRAWRAAVLADTPIDQRHRVDVSLEAFRADTRGQSSDGPEHLRSVAVQDRAWGVAA
jgi:hypothetical protein